GVIDRLRRENGCPRIHTSIRCLCVVVSLRLNVSAVAGRAEMTRSPRVVVVFAPFRSSQVLRSSCARALAVPRIATHGTLIELNYPTTKLRHTLRPGPLQ